MRWRKSFIILLLLPIMALISMIGSIKLRQYGFYSIGCAALLAYIAISIAFIICCIFTFFHSFMSTGFTILLTIISFPVVMFFCSVFMMVSYRIALDYSRPASPDWFSNNKKLVDKLTGLSQELIKKENVHWVGNSGWWDFVFGIKYPDGVYLFCSANIPTNFDSKRLIPAEDTTKVNHLDLPFQPGFQPTDQHSLDPNDYAFCERVDKLIRRVGFHNIKLYSEENIVQYQIYNLWGWDNGCYYIYYYSPRGKLPDEFKYDRKLDNNWYYCRRPRFER